MHAEQPFVSTEKASVFKEKASVSTEKMHFSKEKACLYMGKWYYSTEDVCISTRLKWKPMGVVPRFLLLKFQVFWSPLHAWWNKTKGVFNQSQSSIPIAMNIEVFIKCILWFIDFNKMIKMHVCMVYVHRLSKIYTNYYWVWQQPASVFYNTKNLFPWVWVFLNIYVHD